MDNREIKFRGKRIDNGEWIFGWLFKDCLHGKLAIQQTTSSVSEDRGHLGIHTISRDIIPESVGQLTGLKDKNDKEIYEGDILKWMSPQNLYPSSNYREERGTVCYKGSGFFVKYGEYNYNLENLSHNAEIVGNIHDTNEVFANMSDKTRQE